MVFVLPPPPDCIPAVSLLYPYCIPTVSSLYPHCILPLTKKNVRTIISSNLNIVKMPYKYKRVCPICQRLWVVNLSSHLEMVHDLSANERADYLTCAILCTSTPSVHARVPTTTLTAKLKNSRQRHDRRVVQLCQTSLNKTPTIDMLPEPYPNFRLRHKFSMTVVGPGMSGKSYFVKELLERDGSNMRITGNVQKYTGSMDSIKTCLRTWKVPKDMTCMSEKDSPRFNSI